MTRVPFIVGGFLLLVACQGQFALDTPNKKLLALEVGFEAAVEELERYCDLGVIELEKCKEAVPYVQAGSAALDTAQTINTGGGDISGQLSIVRTAILALPRAEGR